jgi:hypothetical protein
VIASGYAPSSFDALAALGGALGAIVAGLALMERVRRPILARTLAWGFGAGAIAAMDALAANEPAGLRMLALCGAGLYAMKGIVLAERRIDIDAERATAATKVARKADANHARFTPAAWLGFVLAWPGMRPSPFAEREGEALSGAGELVRRGATRLLAGAALVAASRIAWRSTNSHWIATPSLLIGLSLAVHFGLFNLLAAAWRRAGVAVGPIFRSPLAATSLASFWSRRWNLAFSEMTQISACRPLRPVVGERWAAAIGFMLSGLLHEMAISLPARAGWGGPTLYFAIHGALVLAEPALARRWRWLGGERPGVAARLWMLGWLALPLPLLFHEPFLAGVVWPLLG